ncbi:hypothetical protein [Frankia sp. Cj3]|uniref:hypothetical protein n=1 Tax=Frankia sp. Cj3 TaxID=2880976 RepID=UPI001EF70979|nr:hypothetical protein [Frankia sp. Cj3]
MNEFIARNTTLVRALAAIVGIDASDIAYRYRKECKPRLAWRTEEFWAPRLEAPLVAIPSRGGGWIEVEDDRNGPDVYFASKPGMPKANPAFVACSEEEKKAICGAARQGCSSVKMKEMAAQAILDRPWRDYESLSGLDSDQAAVLMFAAAKSCYTVDAGVIAGTYRWLERSGKLRLPNGG